MTKFKKGDRVVVIKIKKIDDTYGYNQNYPKIGWEGIIEEYIEDWEEYVIEWDFSSGVPENVNGDLIKGWMIKKIVKKIKQYGIVNFLKGIEKCQK